MNSPAQCPGCGNNLNPEDRFCSSCGRPIATNMGTPPPIPAVTPPPVVHPPVSPTPAFPPAPAGPVEASAPMTPPPVMPTQAPPPTSSPPAEQVISVVSMVRKKTGLFSSDLYHMVITNQRLIFALQTKEMQNQDVKNARDQAKQQGKGFLGQIGAQISTRYGDKYLGMAPHLIMTENPQNFAINLDEVLKISIHHGDFDENEPDTMEIKTTREKIKFNISNYYNVDKQLKNVLGAKVR